MKQTPLCDALRSFASSAPLRMHMPGHKGRPMPLPELNAAAALDFTELPPTGNLFEAGGPIQEAEELWACAFGSKSCLFLTGGSTQGVLSAFTLCCRPGDRVLLDRGCHRSSFNALALLDLHPRYLDRPWLEEPGVTGPVSPEQVDRALTEWPDIKTVCITSPTYYGVLSDIPAIARAAHAHGARLIVDGAHGAHLPFLGNFDLATADVTVVSAHKTLPAPGQSALLFSSVFSPEELRRAGSIYGSSSPSYPMMAALDAARAWMEEEGREGLCAAAAQVGRLRERFPSLTVCHAPLDPARLVFSCPDGHRAEAALESMGIYPEMADSRHVVFICTSADTPEDFVRLEEAWSAVLKCQPHGVSFPPLPPAPAPVPVLSPRQARFSPAGTLPLRAAEGRISACQVAPYPPGIPVIAPGELITKKTIAYLSQIGYNMEKDTEVVCL